MLSIDAAQDLRSVTSPAAETYGLDYGNHLLNEMRSPRGALHKYQYTPQGRLIRDKNPGRGGWTLTRTPPAVEGGYTVDMTTDGGRTTSYVVSADKFATERTHAITHADGTASQSIFKNGETIETHADGSTTTVFDNPDPRFGIRAPISDVIRQTPAGLRREERTARSVTLSVPSDPTSLQAWSETHTLNGAMSSVSFNVATRTLTGRSFASHTQSLVFDAQGYPAELQRPALHPVTMGYDVAGRLETIRQSTRETVLHYDPQGRLESIRDPALRTTRWGRDSAGRVNSITRPDSQLIILGRDAHGNVTSVTPPSRPAHSMSYSSMTSRRATRLRSSHPLVSTAARRSITTTPTISSPASSGPTASSSASAGTPRVGSRRSTTMPARAASAMPRLPASSALRPIQAASGSASSMTDRS